MAGDVVVKKLMDHRATEREVLERASASLMSEQVIEALYELERQGAKPLISSYRVAPLPRS